MESGSTNFPEEASSIRVLLIHNHKIIRAGLRLLIDGQTEMKVVGEVDKYSDAIAAVGHEQPDIVLLDLVMGAESSIDYIPKLVGASLRSRVLILTAISDPDLHQRAVQMGAMGIVTLEQPPEVLIKAIRKIHQGEAWLDRATVGNLLSEMSRNGKAGKRASEFGQAQALTRRERDIIGIVAQGLKNRQIAEQLSISEITVRHHLTSIFDKLAVADRFELIIYAYKHGLCDLPR
jgi:two-component system, NarL family, nitrate/nitrite response regulator NarL